MFNNSVKLFVEHCNVYRVTTHCTIEYNHTTKPINGCIFVYNPYTCLVCLIIIHSSELEG